MSELAVGASGRRPRGPRGRGRSLGYAPWVPYAFISPWIVGFLAFTLGPLVFSLVMSLCDWGVFGSPRFIGLGNFARLLSGDGQFWASLGITFKFAALFVPLEIVASLLLALLVAEPVKGAGFFRSLFYLPSVVSSVAVAVVWGWILDSKFGLLNYVIELAGGTGPAWLQDPKWALLAMVLSAVWGLGTMMLIFYTTLKNIPRDIYEDALIAGASGPRRFFSITLPLITPTILFNVVTGTIGAMQSLALALLLTKGGPLRSTYFYGLFVYNNAFAHFKLGYAAAASWLMFALILAMTAIIFRSSSAWVFYENEVAAKKGGGS